jgi:sodium/hydrogen antiporter
MEFNIWFVITGLIFVFMALADSVLRRLPLTTAMLYIGLGAVLSPAGVGLLRLDPFDHSALLERLTEVVVIISLFSAGLKLRTPLRDGRWRLPARLASGSMIATVGMITLAGMALLDLPLGAAVLLGAVLAPTDPVLASDVQVRTPLDQDVLRFSLTGEAGLNDGTAFPFVMLGLGLLGLHELGAGGWRWIAVDVVWAIGAGLAIGWLLGTGVGHLVLYLRRQHRESVGLDDFLALGLIALAYGVALLAHSYGFLAVFAAGLALRRIERHSNGDEAPEEVVGLAMAGESEEVATNPETAPAYMAQAVLGFSEQLERIGVVGVVLLLGGLLSLHFFTWERILFAILLFLLIRPLSVLLGLAGAAPSRTQRNLIAWFGVRGVGGIYYLMFAIQHGLPEPLADTLVAVTLVTVAFSVVAHGISVTPLMNLYQTRIERHLPRVLPQRRVQGNPPGSP